MRLGMRTYSVACTAFLVDYSRFVLAIESSRNEFNLLAMMEAVRPLLLEENADDLTDVLTGGKPPKEARVSTELG